MVTALEKLNPVREMESVRRQRVETGERSTQRMMGSFPILATH